MSQDITLLEHMMRYMIIIRKSITLPNFYFQTLLMSIVKSMDIFSPRSQASNATINSVGLVKLTLLFLLPSCIKYYYLDNYSSIYHSYKLLYWHDFVSHISHCHMMLLYSHCHMIMCYERI